MFLERKKKLKNKPHDVTECFIIYNLYLGQVGRLLSLVFNLLFDAFQQLRHSS